MHLINKLIDMKNTTAEIMRTKKINKKSHNHQEKGRREHITSTNISLKGSCPSQKFLKTESNTQPNEIVNKNNPNTTRNPYLSKDMFNQSSSKSDQCITHRIDKFSKPDESYSINQLRLDWVTSPHVNKSPFYSSYEIGIKPHFQTPSNEVLNTEYTNHETELRYDSETWEVSFSNEKSKKTTRNSKITIPANILMYP